MNGLSEEFFGGLMIGAVIGTLTGEFLDSLLAGVAVGVVVGGVLGVYFHIDARKSSRDGTTSEEDR